MDIEVPNWLKGNTTSPEAPVSGKAGYQENEDDAVFHPVYIFVKAATEYLRKHGQERHVHNCPPSRSKGLLDETREAITKAPIHITQKGAKFNAQARVRHEVPCETRARLGLRHNEIQQENLDEYDRRKREIWEKYPYSKFELDLHNYGGETHPDLLKREEELRKLDEWEKTHPRTITDPIPEGTERQLVVEGNNYKDRKWEIHVLNDTISL